MESISESGQGYISCPPPKKEERKGFKLRQRGAAQWGSNLFSLLSIPPRGPPLTSQPISAFRIEVLKKHQQLQEGFYAGLSKGSRDHHFVTTI